MSVFGETADNDSQRLHQNCTRYAAVGCVFPAYHAWIDLFPSPGLRNFRALIAGIALLLVAFAMGNLEEPREPTLSMYASRNANEVLRHGLAGSAQSIRNASNMEYVVPQRSSPATADLLKCKPIHSPRRVLDPFVIHESSQGSIGCLMSKM